MKKKIIVFFLAMFLTLLNISYGSAHYLWVDKVNTNEFEFKWGHIQHISEPYDPEMIKEIKAFNVEGKIIPVEKEIFPPCLQNKVILRSKEKISLIALISTPKYNIISLTSKVGSFYLHHKHYEMTKEEAQKKNLQISGSFYLQEFTKSLFTSAKIITEPIGLKFEIVPLKDPFNLKDNDILPIKVLFDGKPLEGAAIMTEGSEKPKEVGKTDKQGLAYVKISEIKSSLSNEKVIIVAHHIPFEDTSKADYYLFVTVLYWK